MPSILSDEDKQIVKRTVPKSSNKIQAVAVAKLYIAYPNHQRWTYTGLQGAAVLANDLVGNTYWIKLVDVSPANRGAIWDQEIYDTFNYNQDRTFFHSFEGEDCMFGLSFADEKEAKQFLKKMNEREKNAHKNTKSRPFASGPAQVGVNGQQSAPTAGKSHGLFGGLFSSHRSSSASHSGPTQSIIPPKGVEIHAHTPASGQASPGFSRPANEIDLSDPAVQKVLQELQELGISGDQIEEHKDFILTYLEQSKATAKVEAEKRDRATRAPPPPPPVLADLSPQNTGQSGRGPPPAPPPSRRKAGSVLPAIQRPSSPSPSPPREPSPPRPRFRAPPPIADAGKFANEPVAARKRAESQSTPGPPPPPRPPKVLLEEEPASTPGRFAVPPPFDGKRVTSGLPPPSARNGGGPPAPPPRESSHTITAGAPPPPPPPPRIPVGSNTDTFTGGSPIPPPLPPTTARPVMTAPVSDIPPPPPLPPSTAGSNAPPPPPLPPLPPQNINPGPPPPPPMPPRAAAQASESAPALPKAAAAEHGGLLADIRGGARLKKVTDQEKRDRSGALVPGTENAVVPPSSSGGGGGGDAQGGLAGALASALAARKSKVSHSDDEKDDDDW